MAKQPPKNVKKLIADHTPEPKASLPGRFKRRPVKPPPKQPPRNVISLIENALRRKGK